jgi:hypothetical protein
MCSQNPVTLDGRGNQIGWPPKSPDVDPFEFCFLWNSREEENSDYSRNRILTALYSMTLQNPQRAREKTVHLMKI